MPNQVTDVNSGQSYVITDCAIAPSTITVTMGSNIGLDAVCTGPSRPGQVTWNDNTYNVTLPGSFSGMQATFRRR